MMGTNYPGFPYDATELGAYIFSINIFIISLKGKVQLVRYECDEPLLFKKWLKDNGIRDVYEEMDKTSKTATTIKKHRRN